ncbi:guanine nucleotide exchange factor DBS-like isoform X1 [Saccostrea cucullata]|uniref:guanine nucleotide exchange factor DBS-like isoform X1 n=4 Tax=Saccostrea cuccullata TaxID=36930 RepID=UPI002ED2DB78
MATGKRDVHTVKSKSSKSKKAGGIQASKVEHDIDEFLENFRRKSSTLDQPLSSDIQDTLGLPPRSYSSSQCSTDECTDESPDRSYFPPPSMFTKGHHRQHSSTTSESEWGPDYDEEISKEEMIEKLNARVQHSKQAKKAEQESDLMEEQECPYSVLDVASLIQSRYAYITGGKAKNGALILTFPENLQHPQIPDEEYRKLVNFLCCVPTLAESEQGFVIVLDRRQASWNDVRALLLKMSEFFPKHIQVVFLLQPKGFFQRAFADMKSKFVKEELEFKVVLCNEPSEMLDYISEDQLTSDVGGKLEFDANEWTQHKSAVEKFASNTEKMGTAVQVLVKKYEEIEIPNDVPGMEKLIQDHIQGRKEILDDLASTVTHGETLLSCIRGDNSEIHFTQATHVRSLEKLLIKLEEIKKEFEGFWARHEKRLKQALLLRQFEEEFKLYQYNVERKLEWLQTRMSQLGDSLDKVEELFQEFEEFETEAQKDLEQADRMRGTGDQLITQDSYAVDSIRPKCIELQRMCDQYKSLLRRRREMLNKSHDLQDRIDKANKWCNKGVELLSNLPPEHCQSAEDTRSAIEDIENFMTTSNQLRLNNPKEFRQLFESMITPETRTVVQKVLKKMEDVKTMCEKRRHNFQANIHNRQPSVSGPIRAVHPVTDRSSADRPERLPKVPNEANKHIDIYNKSARIRTDVPPRTSQHTAPSVSNISDTGSEKTRSSLSSMSLGSSISDIDTLLAKRRHVLNELIESEKTYVSQLADIVHGYERKLDDPEMRHLIPDALRGRKEILFGNLEQIYRFHKDKFLHELEDCHDAPAKVGQCFTNRKEEFHLYSVYCQNKTRSETLRNQVGDQNPFFLECQRRLGHKLPLGAYLLKPVQRITKYQLLLKEMLRFSDHDQTCEAHLQEALDCMLEVVRYVNDSMHQVSIVGFPGNLSEQGKLIMQGSFQMSTEHKGKIKDLRFKPMQRHMFLHQKSILLCKQKEDTNSSDKVVYSFKNLLKLSQVGLTENVKGDKRKFELWLRGREEVYIIQAPSLAVKEMWVKEIKRVLMNQFDEIKAVNHMHNTSNNYRVPDQEPTNGHSSRRYVDNWRTHNHMIFNNISTVPQGLEMMSPESPPRGTKEEEGGWDTDDFSDGEEATSHQTYSPPVQKQPVYMQHFRSLGNYTASDPTELTLLEGDVVKVIKTASTGWWFAQHTITQQEGWVPSTYMEPLTDNSLSSINSSPHDYKSSLTSVYTASPVDESTV